MNNTVFWGLDLEMEQPSNEIISIGVSIWAPKFMTDNANFLVTPTLPVSEFIQNLTGLKDEMFNREHSREVCFRQFVDYMQLSKDNIEASGLKWHPEPITWGAGDLHTLRSQMGPQKQNFMGRRFIDVKTLCMLERLYSGKSISGKMSLASGLGQYGLQFEGSAHNSAADAYNTMRLFDKIVRMNTRKNDLIREISNLK